MTSGFFFVLSFLGYVISAPALAQEFSGFLDDYSGMKEISPHVFQKTIPNPEARLAKFDSIMIDQPEFILDEDSKVSGLKPDEMKLIVDTLRAALMKQFERSSYRLVSSPGPTTLYMRTAITDVGLKKKRKKLVQFTPIGLAATIATSPLRDVMDKLVLQRFAFEGEMLVSDSGESLGQFVDRSRATGDKKEKASWETLNADLTVAASRAHCRLENGKVSADARTDCNAKFPFADTE